MTSTVTHSLQQFRYLTDVSNPLPWPHVRQVNVSELRHEAPDLPLMVNLTAGLSSCDTSLREIREHNDADILQLVQVLQACLQFSLWSQNILKEKLLEVQSTYTARRVSAQMLEKAERRTSELSKALKAITEERDTLSLGSASLRTSLLQMETTVKMQERQLRQERERGAELLSTLEKTLRAAPAVVHKLEPQFVSPSQVPPLLPTRTRHAATISASRKGRTASTPPPPVALPLSDMPEEDSCASDTTYSDRAAPHEAHRMRYASIPQPHHSLTPAPPPFLDWRTLVRYILHEEESTRAAVVAPPLAKPPVEHDPPMSSALPTPSSSSLPPPPPPPAKTEASPVAPPVSQEQFRALFAELADALKADVAAYTRSTASHTDELVRSLVGQGLQKTQQTVMEEVRAALRSFPSVLVPQAKEKDVEVKLPDRTTPHVTIASATKNFSAQPRQRVASPLPPTACEKSASSPTAAPIKAAPASIHTPLRNPSDTAASKMQDATPPSPVQPTSASPLLPSLASLRSSPTASQIQSLAAPVTLGQRAVVTRRDSDSSQVSRSSKPRASLPEFSVDILRSPSGSDRGGARPSSRSSPACAASEMDNPKKPATSSSTTSSPIKSPTDSYQSSGERAEEVVNLSSLPPRPFPLPTGAPPVYPSTPKQPTSAPPPMTPTGSAYRNLSLQSTMRSDASEVSSHESSQMLRETRAQLLALLEEEEAAKRSKQQAKAISPS